MEKCWELLPENRPSFSAILRDLIEITKETQTVLPSNFIFTNRENGDTPKNRTETNNFL